MGRKGCKMSKKPNDWKGGAGRWAGKVGRWAGSPMTDRMGWKLGRKGRMEAQRLAGRAER